MKSVYALMGSLLLLTTTVSAYESPEALQDAFAAALSSNDAAGLAACYTADATNYPVGEMVGIGPESVLASWNGFFSSFKVLELSLSDTHMETRGDISAAWGLWHMLLEPAGGGEAVKMDGRFMDVARNVDGNWLYIADHASMPAPGGDEAESE